MLPSKRPPRFRIQIWDKDFFSANDAICEVNISLAGLFKMSHKKKDRVVMKYKGKEKIWIEDLRHPNFKGNQGRVLVSFECMPSSVAQQLPAGFGRSEPNMNPFLDEPDGRAKIVKKFFFFFFFLNYFSILSHKYLFVSLCIHCNECMEI